MKRPDEEKTSTLEDRGANSDRRNFIKDAAAIGLLGAAGMSSGLAQPAEAAPPAPPAREQLPQGPAGMRNPGPQVDCRVPVSFEKSLPEGMRILTQYFSALNRRDQRAMAQAFHYPFVTYEGIDTVIVESADQLLSSPPPSLNVTGNGRNKIRLKSYDILDKIELLLYGPCGAGFSLDYSRYHPDGHKLFGAYGIYGVTNNDGKWGIEYMSTIFRPADQLHTNWDAEAFALRSVHDACRVHYLDRRYGRLPQLFTSSHEAPGKWGSVYLDAGSTKYEGIKSRLHVVEVTREQMEHTSEAALERMKQNQVSFMKTAGQGIGPYYQSLELPNARVLAADMEKAHVADGFIRYTEDGSVISVSGFMSVVLFRDNYWSQADGPGMFCCSLIQNLGSGTVMM